MVVTSPDRGVQSTKYGLPGTYDVPDMREECENSMIINSQNKIMIIWFSFRDWRSSHDSVVTYCGSELQQKRSRTMLIRLFPASRARLRQH